MDTRLQVPSLLQMRDFCNDLDAFLTENPENFAAVHCKVCPVIYPIQLNSPGCAASQDQRALGALLRWYFTESNK
jgi:hypothetical protein